MGTNFYARSKPCSCCGRSDKYGHIGKSSIGWSFTLRGYAGGDDSDYDWVPPSGLHTWDAWKVWLSDKVIVDEYGDEHSLADFEDRVTNRSHPNGLMVNDGTPHGRKRRPGEPTWAICYREFS